jgi:hypothetical protein
MKENIWREKFFFLRTLKCGKPISLNQPAAAMANPHAALEALQCGPSTDSEKRYFGAKSIRSLEENLNFGLQNGDFSKMWP